MLYEQERYTSNNNNQHTHEITTITLHMWVHILGHVSQDISHMHYNSRAHRIVMRYQGNDRIDALDRPQGEW